MTFKKLFFVSMLIVLIGCQENKKTEGEINLNKEEFQENDTKPSTFESKLLDLRDTKVEFNENFKIEKFGMLKQSDSVYSFVLKLDNITSPFEVEKFSIGVNAYDSSQQEPFKASFNPEIEEINGNKYILLTRKIENYSYFDSLELYTYKRKDWKSSGKISSVKFKDILFKDN